VTATVDEILAQRRLRSAELALVAARRRLIESEHDLKELRAHAAQLETALLEREAAHDPEPDRLRAELAKRSRELLLSEQALHAERVRRAAVEAEISRWRETPVIDGVERELAVALRRVAALDGELELVRRHASEFEHGIQVAVDAAWAWLGEMADRFGETLAELEELRALPHMTHEAPAVGDVESGAVERGEPLARQAPAAGDGGAGAADAGAVEPGRLDEALARLREHTPTAAADEPDGSGPGSATKRRWRLFRGR